MWKAMKITAKVVVVLVVLFVTFFAGVFTQLTLYQRHERKHEYPPAASAMLRLAENLREGKTSEALDTADYWAANFLCRTGALATGEDIAKAPPEILDVWQEAKEYYERYDVNEPSYSPVGYVKNHMAKVPWSPMQAAKKDFNAKYGGGTLERAPVFEIEHWFGKSISAGDMEGKVILLDFWNVGCKPCEKSLPKLQAIYEQYGPKGLVVIGLAGGPTKVTAEFLKKHGYTFPAGRETEKTWLNFAIEGVPSYFMIDKQGRLAWGPQHDLPDANEIERLLEAAEETLAASARPLSQDESALLHKIAAMNGANYEMLNSFQCEYSIRRYAPSEDGWPASDDNGKGKRAMTGDKIFISEQRDSGEQCTFVRNGSQAWSKGKKPGGVGLVTIGSYDNGNVPAILPDPWSLLDGGLGQNIDKVDPTKRQVARVQEVDIDGRKMIEVTVNNVSRGVDDSPVTFPVKIFYSVSEGYLPVKAECDFVSPPSQGFDIHSSSKAEIMKIDVNGNALFIPVSYTHEARFHGQEPYRIAVDISPGSIRINPELPEDLFVMRIEPDDQVIDAETHKELRGPREAWGKSDAYVDVAYARMSKAIRQFKARYGGGKLEKAPQFEIEHWFGQPVSASDMAGKVILLDFWNVGCKPCEKSLPQVQAIHEKYGPKGLVVIGLAGGPTKVTAEFLKKHGYTFPAGRETEKTWLNFAIEGVPSYFMIDKQGRLAWGPQHDLPDANEIERLLKGAGGS